MPSTCRACGRRDGSHAIDCRAEPFSEPRARDLELPEQGSAHGLDTVDRVCFYEQEFYPLSNFSSFTLQWKGLRFDTSEAAYHWEKFPGDDDASRLIRQMILAASSAHTAFNAAAANALNRRPDWDRVKVGIMREILRAKVEQHEYVRRKLLETGTRELVENSWRDAFWGWGPNRDGQNQLGRLWMEIRAEVLAARETKEGRWTCPRCGLIRSAHSASVVMTRGQPVCLACSKESG